MNSVNTTTVRKREMLDWLPKDVHERVAKFICANSYYEALSFAQQSEKQRLAMVEALDYKLTVNDAFKEDAEDWIAIFGDSVRKLDSSRLINHDLPESFVDLPNLSSAEIYGKNSHFRTVKRSLQLKSLRVIFDNRVDWDELVETCASLPLEELCLKCNWSFSCRLAQLCSDDLYRLSQACPYVTKLDMNCSCFENTCNFWPLVSSFSSLSHLLVHRMVGEEAIEFLESLKEVEFHGNMPIRRLISVGRGVTAVTQLRRACEQTVALLANFPKLRVLQLAMLNGAEKALPAVIENIERLDLTWGYDDFYDEEDDVGYGDGAVDVDQRVKSYYPLDRGLLEEILQSAQHLQQVHLRKAVVKADAVVRIIEKVGKRLKKLSIHMDQQGEAPAFRLCRILQAASSFCPNVTEIELLGPLVEKEATLQQKQNCYKALERLKITSPLITANKLRMYINGIEIVPEA